MEGLINFFAPENGINWFEEIAAQLNLYSGDINNEMIAEAVQNSSDFFGIPNPADTIHDSSYGPAAASGGFDKSSYSDDVVAHDKYQMYLKGFESKDSVELVMTHEAAHRVFQNDYFNETQIWEEELACDYMAGVRAGMQGIPLENMENAMSDWQPSISHPPGDLRVNILNYGKEIGEQMIENGENPTFETSIEHLNEYLLNNSEIIAEAKESIEQKFKSIGAEPCDSCNGSGTYWSGRYGTQICPNCKGTGLQA